MDTKTTQIAAIVVIALVVAGSAGGYLYLKGKDPGNNDREIAENVPCAPYSFTDLAGQEWEFDHTFGAVALQMSLQGGAFLTMACLLGEDLPKYIAGLDDLNEASPDTKAAWTKAMPELNDIPAMGWIGFDDTDATNVLALSPNALIMPVVSKMFADMKEIPTNLAKNNVPTIYLDFHSENVENITKSIKILGMMFGKNTEANDLANLYQTKAQGVYDKVAEILLTKERPSVFVELATYGAGQIGHSYSNNSMWGALAYKCGADSILKGEDQGTLDSPFILAADPDYILFVTGHGSGDNGIIPTGFDADPAKINKNADDYFKQRAGWSDLTAYKDGKVIVVNQGICRDAMDFVSLEFLAKTFWPEEFASVDPIQDLKDFYANYLPVPFSGVWYQQLGATA